MFISKWAFEFAYFFNGGLRRVRGTWGVVTGLLVPWAPPSLWALWRGVRLPAAPLQWRQWKQLGKIVRKDPEEWQPCEGRAAGLGGQGSWRAMVPGLPGHPSPPRTAPALRSPLEGKQRKGPFWPEPFRSNVKPLWSLGKGGRGASNGMQLRFVALTNEFVFIQQSAGATVQGVVTMEQDCFRK